MPACLDLRVVLVLPVLFLLSAPVLGAEPGLSPEEAEMMARLDRLLDAREGEPAPDRVTIEWLGDSEGGSGYSAEADIGLFGKRMYLGGGRQRVPDKDIDEEHDNVNSFIGFQSDPADTLVLGMEYRYWDTRDELRIDSLRGLLTLNVWNLAFSVWPERRNIEVVFELPNNGQVLEFDIESSGYTSILKLQGPRRENWGSWIYGGHASFVYSENLGLRLLRLRRPWLYQQLVSRQWLMNGQPSTSTVERQRSMGGVGVSINNADLMLDWMRSISAVDESKTEVVLGSLVLRASTAWQWYASVGQQTHSLSEDEIVLYSIGLQLQF